MPGRISSKCFPIHSLKAILSQHCKLHRTLPFQKRWPKIFSVLRLKRLVRQFVVKIRPISRSQQYLTMFPETALQNLITSSTGNHSWKETNGPKTGQITDLRVMSCCAEIQIQRPLKRKLSGFLMHITRNKPLTIISGLVLNVMVMFIFIPTLTKAETSQEGGSS